MLFRSLFEDNFYTLKDDEDREIIKSPSLSLIESFSPEEINDFYQNTANNSSLIKRTLEKESHIKDANTSNNSTQNF